jgi:hypothetical protein
MSRFFRPGARDGGRYRMVLVIRVGMLAVLLLATFIFHVSGTALVELRIARLAIFVALVAGVGWVSRRHKRLNSTTTPRDDGASRPPA